MSSLNKPQHKIASYRKTNVREFINIQEFKPNQSAKEDLRQKFISQLAKQCNFAFQNVGHPSLYASPLKVIANTELHVANANGIQKNTTQSQMQQESQVEQGEGAQKKIPTQKNGNEAKPSQFLPFWERIWKNQMLEKAGSLFPQLNQYELQKLVDRDWRIMRVQTKEKISEKYMKKRASTLQSQILSFEDELNSEMGKIKSKNLC